MNYWMDSFGFRVVIAAGAIYALGMVFFIIYDIRP
jgi:hypothetical protein